MTNLKSLIVAAAAISLPAAAADFTNSFEGVTAGSDLSLAWATAAAAQNDHPLCITAQVIDRGEDGTKANAYKVNVTTSATGSSFTWTGVPYPLRRVKGGLYQVEVRDCSGAAASSSTPALAKSPFFGIEEEEEEEGATEDGPAPTSSSPSSPKPSSSGPPAINKTALGIGLGVAIGVPSLAALAVVGWCFRKRQKKAAEERRRARRRDFVIY